MLQDVISFPTIMCEKFSIFQFKLKNISKIYVKLWKYKVFHFFLTNFSWLFQ